MFSSISHSCAGISYLMANRTFPPLLHVLKWISLLFSNNFCARGWEGYKGVNSTEGIVHVATYNQRESAYLIISLLQGS